MNFALSTTHRRVAAAMTVSLGLVLAGTDLAWTASAAPAAATGTKIGLRHSSHGKVLDGASRKFVYVHLTAAGKDAACNPLCQGVWPHVSTTGKPRAGHGVKAAKLGERSGQVTYRGHRLYYYAFSPQTTAGDGAKSFGGTWLLINAKGKTK
jgi:predicted lipoprotein with Yx(FWY)xxD motif